MFLDSNWLALPTTTYYEKKNPFESYSRHKLSDTPYVSKKSCNLLPKFRVVAKLKCCFFRLPLLSTSWSFVTVKLFHRTVFKVSHFLLKSGSRYCHCFCFQFLCIQISGSHDFNCFFQNIFYVNIR